MTNIYKSILIGIVLLLTFTSSAQEIILIRHAKVKLETKGWMGSKKATEYRHSYDTSAVYCFKADTVLSKIPNRITDTVYTSTLYRSMATAGSLFDDSVTYISMPALNEFELDIIKLPLVLPYKAWASISRATWLLGRKSESKETHKEAKQRVKNAVLLLEEKAKLNKQVIFVSHGYINRNIKNLLVKRGWKVKHNHGKENLGAFVLFK